MMQTLHSLSVGSIAGGVLGLRAALHRAADRATPNRVVAGGVATTAADAIIAQRTVPHDAAGRAVMGDGAGGRR